MAMCKVPPRSLQHSRSRFEEVAKGSGTTPPQLTKGELPTLFQALGLHKEASDLKTLDSYFEEMDSGKKGCITFKEMLYFLVYHPEVVGLIESALDNPQTPLPPTTNGSAAVNTKSPKKVKKKPASNAATPVSTHKSSGPESAPAAVSEAAPSTPQPATTPLRTKEDTATPKTEPHSCEKRKETETPSGSSPHSGNLETEAKKAKTSLEGGGDQGLPGGPPPEQLAVPRRSYHNIEADAIKAKTEVLEMKIQEKLEAESREKEAIAAEAHKKHSAPSAALDTSSPSPSASPSASTTMVGSKAEGIMARVRAKEEKEMKQKAELAAEAGIELRQNSHKSTPKSEQAMPCKASGAEELSRTFSLEQTNSTSWSSYLTTGSTGLFAVLATVTAVAAFSYSRGYLSGKR